MDFVHLKTSVFKHNEAPILELIDAQPLIERRVDNIWERAAEAGDRIYDDFLRVSREQGIDALVLKTNPAIHPPQVKFEFWLPQQDSLTARCDVIVSIEPKPFHRYDLEFNLETTDRGKKKKIRRLRQFSKGEVACLVLYLLRKGPKPIYYDIRIRRFPFQLWRPKNKITCIRFDWVQNVPAILFVSGVVWVTVVPQASPAIWLSTTLMLFMSGGCFGWALRRPKVFRSSGKPHGEPRNLILVDMWQTIVFGAGDDYNLVQERLLKVLEEIPTERFRYRIEQHWAWGLDGKEEREQVVLSFNRAILFCQIYQYGKGLYVGWDAHLNIGQWVEQKIAQGIDRTTRRLANVCTVVPGLQMVTRYDLADLNCLIEWTHGQIIQLVKRFIAEKKIDQEIDFKILRGDREDLFSGKEKARSESAPWHTTPERPQRTSIWVGTRSGRNDSRREGSG